MSLLHMNLPYLPAADVLEEELKRLREKVIKIKEKNQHNDDLDMEAEIEELVKKEREKLDKRGRI